MKKSIYKILTLTLAVVLITGCSWLEDFGDTNLNPAATTTPNTAALLTNVLAGLGGYGSNSATGAYCQFFSETQYSDFSRYSLNLASPAGTYAGSLYDLQNIIITNTDAATKDVAALNGANANQIAIARIVKAYIFWTLTDRWGDLPYTDALKGDPNVAYSTQEVIYKDLIKELTEAVAQFTTGAALKGDLVYAGDVAKWKKAANSMRMLMALRLSKQYPLSTGYAATEFKAALNDAAGHISTNADNFKLAYPGGSFKSPEWSRYDGRKDWGESETMTRLLVDTLNGDQRQLAYGGTVNGAASNQGVPYGWRREDVTAWTNANPNYCYVWQVGFRTETSPVHLIKASSVLLARAEAADRGWTTETANTVALYESGIAASYSQYGLPAPTIGYLTGANVALAFAPGTGLNIKRIATQQYVAYYPDGTQGWSNWRRTGFPILLPARDATNTPPVIPRRYMYGPTDYALTKAGVEAAVLLLGTNGDKMDSRVWWDKL